MGGASHPGPQHKTRRRAISSNSESVEGDRDMLLDALEQDFEGKVEPTVRDDSGMTTQWTSGASFHCLPEVPSSVLKAPCNQL